MAEGSAGEIMASNSRLLFWVGLFIIHIAIKLKQSNSHYGEIEERGCENREKCKMGRIGKAGGNVSQKKLS